MIVKFSVLALSFLLTVCGDSNSNATKIQNSAENKTISQTENAQTKQMIKIQQGTVGKIGDFSVGISNISNSSARFSIWNKSLPQVDRNDYLITTIARTGEITPIGKDFYRIGKISENSADQKPGTVEIESEPVKTGGSSFAAETLALPTAGILELHGTSIELLSIKTDGGKTAAEIEIYSNNYPKETLAQKGEIKKSEFAAGDEITIGSKKHKIVAIHPAKENARGVVEISISSS